MPQLCAQQTVFVLTEDNTIVEYDLETCTSTDTYRLPIQIAAISSGRDSLLYGISENGVVLEIDRNTNKTRELFELSDANNLIFENIFYLNEQMLIISNIAGQFFAFDLDQNILIELGFMGDFGYLDAAYSPDGILALTLDNQIRLVRDNDFDQIEEYYDLNGVFVIDILAEALFAQIDDCNATDLYILANQSNVYSIVQFVKEQNTASSICEFTDFEVRDVTSLSENKAGQMSRPELAITQPVCGDSIGSLTIDPTNLSGENSFRLNPGDVFSSRVQYDSLTSGHYILETKRPDGCIDSSEFSIDSLTSISFVNTFASPAVCENENGFLQVQITDNLGLWQENIIETGDDTGLNFTVNGLNLPFSFFSEQQLPGDYAIQAEYRDCSIDTLMVIGEDGCFVEVPNAIFIANNEDPDVNTTLPVFLKKSTLGIIRNYNIYDRWGNLLYSVPEFRSDELNLFFNTTRCPDCNEGTYVYQFELSMDNAETFKKYSGSFSMFRK